MRIPELGQCVAAAPCHAALAEEAVTKYVPGPVQVGPQIWAGAIAATIPFVIGSWEFAKRIVRLPLNLLSSLRILQAAFLPAVESYHGR